jgi:4a-hydroxytetrahydrobiopterin dehydratase
VQKVFSNRVHETYGGQKNISRGVNSPGIVKGYSMGKLSDSDIEREMKLLKGWSHKGAEIQKKFEFSDFVHAMGFVNSVALLAEKANHHPDIDIRWGAVTLTLSTHSEEGLTEKDFTLARRIESL